jgi:hypothetical protein
MIPSSCARSVPTSESSTMTCGSRRRLILCSSRDEPGGPGTSRQAPLVRHRCAVDAAAPSWRRGGREGKTAIQVYGCGWHRVRGDEVCVSTLRRPVTEVNVQVTDWVRKNILTEQFIVETIRELRGRLVGARRARSRAPTKSPTPSCKPSRNAIAAARSRGAPVRGHSGPRGAQRRGIADRTRGSSPDPRNGRDLRREPRRSASLLDGPVPRGASLDWCSATGCSTCSC